jgi:hypothetical protein
MQHLGRFVHARALTCFFFSEKDYPFAVNVPGTIHVVSEMSLLHAQR